jgi:O-antigen/teichoic acid export membrane protein
MGKRKVNKSFYTFLMMKKNEKKGFNNALTFIAKSSVFLFVSLVLSKVFTYLYRILVARAYSPEVYGMFALSIVITGAFTIVAEIGLRQGMLRYISIFRGEKKYDNISYITRFTLKVLLLTSLAAMILLYLSSEFIATKFFNNTGLIVFLKIFSIQVPLVIFSGAFLSILRSYEKINSFAFISNILDSAVKPILLGILILAGLSALSVPISYVSTGLITAIVAFLVLNKKLSSVLEKSSISENKKKEIVNELISYSWPLIFFGVITSIFFWTDTFMIGLFRTVEEVGFYNAAVPLAWIITISTEVFVPMFLPMITKEYYSGRKEVVKQLSQQVGKWILMIIIPIFILINLFPGFFINLLFGPEYLPAINSLRFLSIGAVFLSLFGVSRELLFMKGKSRMILIDTLVAAVINITLNYFLVPPYGIDGAGLSTMISLIIFSLIFAYQSYKYLGIIPIRRKMATIIVVALITSAVIISIKGFVQINLLWSILLGIIFILIYAALLLFSGSLDIHDKRVLNLFLKKLFAMGRKRQ